MVRQLEGSRAEASAVGIVFSRRRRVHETGIRGIIAASVASSVWCAGIGLCQAFFASGVNSALRKPAKENKLSVAVFALVASRHYRVKVHFQWAEPQRCLTLR